MMVLLNESIDWCDIMSIIDDLDKILISARRNPEQNPKISLKNFLSKYKDTKDLYVSFKSFEKMGINPTAKWGHMSPMGVYAYPLNFVIRTLEAKESCIGMDLPFAFDKKLAYVIKKRDVPGLIFIDNIQAYDNDQLTLDIEKIRKYVKDELKFDKKSLERVEGIISAVFEANENYYSKEFKIIYNITQYIGSFIGRTNSDDESKQKINKASQWNSLFRKCLGYSGCADKFNSRIIHGDIPYETIFFTTRAYEVLDAYNNISYNVNKGLILHKLYVKFIQQYIDESEFDASNSEFTYNLNGKNYIIEVNLTEDPEDYDDSDYNINIREEDSTSLMDLPVYYMNEDILSSLQRYLDKNPYMNNTKQIVENFYPIFENALKSMINKFILEHYQ